MSDNTGNILIYQNEKGDTKIDVYFNDETIWMTQKSIAELYHVKSNTITEHIKNIYADGELEEGATTRKFRVVQKEGNREVSREVNHYNLQVILAIGYHVRNNIGMNFRNWAYSCGTNCRTCR